MRRLLSDQVFLLAWLALVWVLLWGTFSPAVLLSAVVVAPLCLAACRLPVLPRARPRLWRFPGVLGRFAVDVVVSSLQVAWATVRRGPHTRSAVVAVPLRCASDVALTVAANRISLVPGTLVLDIDRDVEEMYVYVFDVRRTEDLDRARDDAARSAADVLRALGEDTAAEKGGGQS
ncbi:Na+/H+ antiporter subunit E [Thermobifida halotolerans]|uniref:Na+/H+ antiporter subunit E n=1 Tax=Thermobifida halotolerans TaxID=483545 RepID=UPI000838A1C4|nr:Na+/H+ antiporter subunit E [Thermobifida halotolerans]